MSESAAHPNKNRIRGIVVEGDDVSFYFDESDEAWSIEEFVQGTHTRERLEAIEAAILDFNFGPRGG